MSWQLDSAPLVSPLSVLQYLSYVTMMAMHAFFPMSVMQSSFSARISLYMQTETGVLVE